VFDWVHNRCDSRNRLQEELLLWMRQELSRSQERCDRLTEALAQKSGIDLVMPQPSPQPLEPSPGWWDKKRISPVVISTKEKIG
jgi:hypothetical protein